MIKWFIAKIILLELNTFYDYIRFKKYFSFQSKKNQNKKSIESWILQDKHRIEKGLSLPNPKFNFGEVVIKRLISNISLYEKLYEKNTVYYFGLGALQSYEKFHLDVNKNLPDFFVNAINKIAHYEYKLSCDYGVGVDSVKPLDSEAHIFFRNFVFSRHSCRNFDDKKKISKSVFKEVMTLSIQTPSVCNRQHWHVYFFNGESKNEILLMQNGNSGFSHNIPYIAVITSDLKAFYNANERNQPFIDGGLFAMNLMYSMHSYGISSCALNWCNSFLIDHRFHKLGFIQNSETVIMLLAFGYQNSEGYYAKSPKMPVESFYTLSTKS